MTRLWKETEIESCDLMVFGAHPDDAELLCGGTIIKSSQAGQSVVVVDITEGELSSNGTVESRGLETAKASQILGLSQRINLQFQDGHCDDEPELLPALVRVLRSSQPKCIIGPPPLCRHPDHQALHHALKKAQFFCGLKKYCPELPHINRPLLLHYVEVQNKKPDLLIDISGVWKQRREAVLAYHSQFSQGEHREPTFINEGFLERLERRYRSYGEELGVDYAEPFLTTLTPKIHLPTDLLA